MLDHRELEAGDVDEHVVVAEIAGHPAQPLHRAAQLSQSRVHRRVERRERARPHDAVGDEPVTALEAAHRVRHRPVVALVLRGAARIEIALALQARPERRDALTLLTGAQRRSRQRRVPSALTRQASVACEPGPQPLVEAARGGQGLEPGYRVPAGARRAQGRDGIERGGPRQLPRAIGLARRHDAGRQIAPVTVERRGQEHVEAGAVDQRARLPVRRDCVEAVPGGW
jgi:hypothetical protein